MKFIYPVGIAILLGIVAAWWFTRSEDETNAMPAPAVSSDVDASQQMGGDVETLQQQGSRQPVIPAIESTSGHDVGSDSAMADPGGKKVSLSAAQTEQVALRNAPETIPGQPEDTKASLPSAIDKTGCEAAAKTLKESRSIFDLTPTQAIHYAWSPPYPNAGPSGFTVLQERLLAPLCSGTSAFDQAYPVEMEFVAISIDSQVRILVGDHWISDGTVLSPLSEPDQEYLKSLVQKRRNGAGPNRSREDFERRLARNPRALIVEP